MSSWCGQERGGWQPAGTRRTAASIVSATTDDESTDAPPAGSWPAGGKPRVDLIAEIDEPQRRILEILAAAAERREGGGE